MLPLLICWASAGVITGILFYMIIRFITAAVEKESGYPGIEDVTGLEYEKTGQDMTA